jgi:predicted outer membrane lipoprotein
MTRPKAPTYGIIPAMWAEPTPKKRNPPKP